MVAKDQFNQRIRVDLKERFEKHANGKNKAALLNQILEKYLDSSDFPSIHSDSLSEPRFDLIGLVGVVQNYRLRDFRPLFAGRGELIIYISEISLFFQTHLHAEALFDRVRRPDTVTSIILCLGDEPRQSEVEKTSDFIGWLSHAPLAPGSHLQIVIDRGTGPEFAFAVLADRDAYVVRPLSHVEGNERFMLHWRYVKDVPGAFYMEVRENLILAINGLPTALTLGEPYQWNEFPKDPSQPEP